MLNSTARLLLLLLTGWLLHGCGGKQTIQDGPPPRAVSQAEIDRIPNAVPRIEKPNPANQRPYTVFNKTYYPLKSNQGFVQRGTASWYGKKFHGRRTANGEIYDMYAMTAAHTRLPLPSYVQVHNLSNGRKVIVRVNDRGPFVGNRIIDLSYVAARKLGFARQGTAPVEIRAITQNSTKPRSKPQSPIEKEQGLYVQVAAFHHKANAQKMYRELSRKIAYPLRWTTSQTERGPLYRIQVGPLPSRQIAEQISKRLFKISLNGT